VLDTSAVNKEQNDNIIDKEPETDYEGETDKSAVINEEDNTTTTTAAAKSEAKETADEDVKPKVSAKRKKNVKVDKWRKSLIRCVRS